MTTRQTSIDEDDFQAFVDGQLPPERCRAVMAYLAALPDESSRMSDYRTLNEGLHSLYDEVLYEPLPMRLALISTKLPTCTSSPRPVPGRRRA